MSHLTLRACNRYRFSSCLLPRKNCYTTGASRLSQTRLGLDRKVSTSPQFYLGVRSELPPDGQSNPREPDQPKKEDSQLSDQEWEVRTGRAIGAIRDTLPHFFDTGLMIAIDKETGCPTHSTYGSLPLALGKTAENKNREYLYSPKIRLEYTPSAQLPIPLPETLHVEGLPLYLASSVFIRHTLNALYSDLRVNLTKFIVQTPKQRKDSETSSKPGSMEQPVNHDNKQSLFREKKLLVNLEVVGNARVSGSDGHWDITCTYTFSPKSGMVASHIVNSIQPTPSQAVYESLRSSLSRLIGLQTSPDPTNCHGRAFQKVPVVHDAYEQSKHRLPR